MNNPYLNKYKQTQIETAPKEQILLMLYDGAVRFLNQAKAGFAENDIEKIHNNIIKTQNILTEFQSTLDMENGGEFAKNLYGLYEYLNKRLMEANIKKRVDYLEEVLKHVTELRDTWREAVKKFRESGQSLADTDNIDQYKKISNSDEYEEDDDEEEDDDDGYGEYV